MVALLAAVTAMPVSAQSTKTTATAEVEETQYSQAELDQMLAPIALYPDSVLSHLLIAATYPLEVVMADRWAKKNSKLTGDDAINAVDDKEWDASVKALVAFPTVLKRLSEDLDWTESVGEAFLADEELVLQTIQNLRQRAYDEGNLDSLEHLRVINEDDEIVIEPANKKVVYIPVYNTRIVYGPWWWSGYPPVYWHSDDFYYRRNHVVYWGPSVYISHSFFFSGFHWHNHHVVIIDRPYRRRYYDNYYSNRHIVRREHSRRWQHEERHRRGVEYRNPRTRDYFERRHSTDSNRTRQTAQQTGQRSVRVGNDRRERTPREIQNGLRRNELMVNSDNRNIDTRTIKREERAQRDLREQQGARGQRAERVERNPSQNADRASQNRNIKKERAINDSRSLRRIESESRYRQPANRATDRPVRKEVRVAPAVETRRPTTEDRGAIKSSDRGTNKFKRRDSSSARSDRRPTERSRSIRDRRLN